MIDSEWVELEQAIIDLEGSITEVPVANLQQTHPKIEYSWGTSGNLLQIFEEEQNVTLTRDINLSNPENWVQLNHLDFISAGTTVDSHFIFLKNPNPGTEIVRQATITFD